MTGQMEVMIQVTCWCNFCSSGPMHHISATVMSEQRMVVFQVEMDICMCSQVTPLQLGIARSFLLVDFLPFQLPGTHKLDNTGTLVPIMQLQQEISGTLFAVLQPSPHSIQLSLVADPILLFLKTLAQDVKALLVFLTISTTAS